MDNYELENGEVIYPILKIELDNKNYLFYSNKKDNLTPNDIYVGEELNDELLTVNEEVLPLLEQKYKELTNGILL